jgi:hypothetical protein
MIEFQSENLGSAAVFMGFQQETLAHLAGQGDKGGFTGTRADL